MKRSRPVFGTTSKIFAVDIVAVGLIVGLLATAALNTRNWLLPLIIPVDRTPLPAPEIPTRLVNWPVPYRSQAGLKIHVFTTGEDKLSSHLTGREERWAPVLAFVIERAAVSPSATGHVSDLTVVDTGLNHRVSEIGPGYLDFWGRLVFDVRQSKGMDLPSQMRRAGLPPENVRTVILTHLHTDHAGEVKAFPNATVVVSATEKGTVFREGGGKGASLSEFDTVAHWKEISFAAAPPLGTFDHAVDLFGDGSVILVDTAGHTAGHMSVLVKAPAGPVLIAGDAVAVMADLDELYAMPGQFNRKEYLRHLGMIKGVVNLVPGLHILPGHQIVPVSRRPDILVHKSLSAIFF